MEVQVREDRHDPIVPRLGLTRNIGVGRLLWDTPVLRIARSASLGSVLC